FAHLSLAAETILNKVPSSQLKSFRWNLGCCVPGRILGAEGILPTRQASLEILEIVTDCTCETHEAQVPTRYWNCQVDLTPMRNLKTLCWKAPRLENLRTLSSTIYNNRQHLRNLELDMIDWQKLRSKRTVSLIQLTNLRSLRLRRCDGWQKFLQYIMDRKMDVKLKMFEIQDSSDTLASAENHVLGRFLRSFRGLERLFVSLSGTSSIDPSFWSHVATDRDTLTRFVQHGNYDREIGAPVSDILPDQVMPATNIRSINADPALNSLRQLNTECIGLGCWPKHLKPILAAFAAKSCLRLIHVRQSAGDTRHHPWWVWERINGPLDKDPRDISCEHLRNPKRQRWGLRSQFLDFIEWAFSPQGLTSLQFIMFGDFAYGGRKSWTQVCFCRNDTTGGYVMISRRDARWKQMVRCYSDVWRRALPIP
ncbi:hypothetical protein BKA60DRAFT_662022, partial [Fusarium oxysporum]